MKNSDTVYSASNDSRACLLQCVKFLIHVHIEDQLLKVNVNLWVLYIHTDHSHVYSSTVLVWECINDSWCFSENHWETPSGIVCILWIYYMYINGNQRSLKVLSVFTSQWGWGDMPGTIKITFLWSDHSYFFIYMLNIYHFSFGKLTEKTNK